MPEKKVDAAVKALSICPAAPCCFGPAGCGSSSVVLVVRPAPKSARGFGGMIEASVLIVLGIWYDVVLLLHDLSPCCGCFDP